MSASWKSNFKAHRVAANMGSAEENFVYHREMQSFPVGSGGATLRVRKRAQAPVALTSFQKRLKDVKQYILPGGNRGLVGICFGLALPLTGGLILYSFVATNAGHTTQELYDLQREKERVKAMDSKPAHV
eukprot:TRINITY_DN27937_c0_g1_i1.p1 TRINITY_DN27937_c0_g1~~TRINITY_DN27937_c0_g1_i1.p1  ORF type:complete len:130 (-),score=15.67 TRINITY_DN27937_c0_g1_i1:78-467(-)